MSFSQYHSHNAFVSSQAQRIFEQSSMHKSGLRVIVERMRFRSSLPEWRWRRHWWGPRTSNPLYLSNTNDLASNSLRRFTENLIFCGQNSEKFNHYYSLPVNGNDITERRDMTENEKWKTHPTRKKCQQINHLSLNPKN